MKLLLAITLISFSIWAENHLGGETPASELRMP